MHLVSSFFDVCAGIAQGRKASVFNFNTAVKSLHDTIALKSTGVAPHISRWARCIIEHAHAVCPASGATHDDSIIVAVVNEILQTPGDDTRTAILISTIKSAGDRLLAVDCTQKLLFVDFQYVDDIVSPASSVAQCSQIWEACETYTYDHGPKFNLGPSKSAIMPVGDSPVPADADLPTYFGQPICVVFSYRYVGVLFDNAFTMEAHFSQSIVRWHDAFNDHVGAGTAMNLPFLILAATVPQFVISTALHGVALCVSVPQAERSLNHMHAEWARSVLGIRGHRQGGWQALVACCGWPQRLGTCMLGEAIMLEARMMLLPPTNPARMLLLFARNSFLPCWATAVMDLRVRLGNLPDIRRWLGDEMAEAASLDPAVRRNSLRRFRTTIVSPSLTQYDQTAFEAAGANADWPVCEFLHTPCDFPMLLLEANFSSTQWKSLRVWALVRATGCWPLPLFGMTELQRVIDFCPLCGASLADLCHILQLCSGTESMRKDLFCVTSSWSQFRSLLFQGHPVPDECNGLELRVIYIASVFELAVSALLTGVTPNDVSELIAGAADLAGTGR
jgi:hypothetical protein